jgi:hypothetical protein
MFFPLERTKCETTPFSPGVSRKDTGGRFVPFSESEPRRLK